MTAPIEVSGSEAEAQPDAVLSGVERKAIQGRSLGQIAWLRLRRDKVAMAGGIFVLLLVVVALPGVTELLVKLLGSPPNQFHQNLVDATLGKPNGSFGGISADHIFGIEPINGRDLFSRILYGARVSILIGVLATLVSVVIGTVMGIVAGYFGGWVDTVIARLMDIFLAFPLVLFAISLVGVIPAKMAGLEGNGLRMAVLVFIIGFFNWPYIGRIIRGQTLSLREREFVDAARSLGARNSYILFREILPNLVAPILVYSTLLIPTNILFEAALSFLGVGINPPDPSWGGMLSAATELYTVAPHFVIVPGLAIFVTVLAFNLFGDGLRDALDPRAR
ncbi:ABC transporter permease [Actinomadura viridis]|uniref:Peptide/nickel transport system permease protein/oligopeptide transport system permease protein n=1 Tax=Actinomadura viridis TaxID=58110 RepID=A0A931DF79_9ACTN|nr:ABC transporter permease [Actinomadura viridis]MBG6090029.1 peptide/nickel transport system permease protein/oligopeptide transport system permease protein [Actinomadura viridis]